MKRIPIAHQHRTRTITSVLFFFAGSAFPWFVVLEAGGLSEALASESRPFPLFAAVVASPVCLLIALWALWRMFHWKGLAIFIEGDQLWLTNRPRPLPLLAGAAFELSDPVAILPGLAASQHLAMVATGRRWKYPLPKTTETPSEILDQLRDHMEHIQSSPASPVTRP